MTATIVVTLVVAGLLGVFSAPYLAARPGVQTYCTSFAAGVLLAVILTHVIPEALHDNHKYGGLLIMAGFMGMMFLQQKVLKADPCCGHEHAKHAGLPSYLALVACSVNDGILLGNVQDASNPLLWAMAGHKVTASFALVMLLRETSAGLSTGMRTLYMMVFVAITPAVVVLSHELAFLQPYVVYAVGLGAGALLYVICGGMIPRVEHSAQSRKWVLALFLAGAASMVAVEMIAPHSHAKPGHAAHGHDHPHPHPADK